jgi:hypothetical protein
MAYQDFGAFRTIHTDDYAMYVTDEELGAEAAYERFLAQNLPDDGWPDDPTPTLYPRPSEPCQECGGGYWQPYAGIDVGISRHIPHADECSRLGWPGLTG